MPITSRITLPDATRISLQAAELDGSRDRHAAFLEGMGSRNPRSSGVKRAPVSAAASRAATRRWSRQRWMRCGDGWSQGGAGAAPPPVRAAYTAADDLPRRYGRRADGGRAKGGLIHFSPSKREAPGDLPLSGYVRAIRAHPFVVVLTIVAALAGSAYFLRGAPTYEATARVLVAPISPADSSFTTLPLPRGQGDPARAVETAAGILDSPVAVELTARRVEGAPDADVLQRRISVEPDPESNMVEIVAEADDAALAARLANGFAEAALEQRRDQLRPLVAAALSAAQAQAAEIPADSAEVAEVLRRRIADLEAIRDGTDPTLNLAQEADRPLTAAGPPRSIVLGLVLVAGTVIGLVASLLIELLVPGRVRRETDVVQQYPLPVLARIPFEDARDSELQADESLAVAEAYRALRTQLEIRARDASVRRIGTVVVVTSGERGDGRTRTAIGLAQAVTRRRQTAVVVELDLGAPSLTGRLGLEAAYDIDAYPAEASVADLRTPTPANPRLSAITAPPTADPAAADRISRFAPDLLSELRSEADWIIVDAPPLSEASGVVAIGGAWDQLVLVSRLGHTHDAALVASRDLLDSIQLEPAGHAIVGAARAVRARAQKRREAPSRSAQPRSATP